jgi:hypothetical protein
MDPDRLFAETIELEELVYAEKPDQRDGCGSYRVDHSGLSR